MKIMLRLLLPLLCCCSAIPMLFADGEAVKTIVFDRGQWSPSDWILVKSPRWNYCGKWIQQEKGISNRTPTAPPEELQGKLAGETYTSMVLKAPISGSHAVTATMMFEYQMAPLIVIAPELGRSASGAPEYREHYEIVLYDQGINVWYHYFKNGKPEWKLAAFLKAPFKPRTPYCLEVKIDYRPAGTSLTVTCDRRTFGFLDNTFPGSYYVGITGCEGVNSFYDFTIKN